ncbi:hypothetical protein [uncultured Dokdonia sp.]|uniref:hypothetical protein n=1 Tax=uncultured Dokdonia sp. TaxID=575653 RepID=UPI002610CFB9|nr:hypothetical protein [uncultured Dokdonia sp.]
MERRISISILILFLFIGCKEATLNNVAVKIQENENEVITTNSSNVLMEQDCIFDQATQTDEFLKGIKELENYVWDDESKTAEIILNDHWGLGLTRGGCDHFTVQADFVYDRVIDFEEKKDFIFQQVIWISDLIKDFDGEIIRECIENGRISIEVEDNKRHIHFMDQRLYESYYMSFSVLENISYIHLSYYIN